MRDCSKILITSGLTGGHFFPAVCFAKAYQKEHPASEIWFLLCKEAIPFDLDRHLQNFHVKTIPIDPFPKAFSMKLFLFLIHYPLSVAATYSFVWKLKPAVVASFGSYGSFPAVLAAWLLRVPIVIHEQNRISGKANQVSAFFARWVTTSFPETSGNLPDKKVRYVGYPIRSELRSIAVRSQSMLRPEKKFYILVLGGSQGSLALNRITLNFFSSLTSAEKNRIAVIHITGKIEFERIRTAYSNMKMEHQVYAFSEEMGKLYSAADLVVARAGAGTIFELAVFGLPSILIPYPFAYGHQSENARYVENLNGAVVIEESKLTLDRFRNGVLDLLQNEEKRRKIKNAVQNLDVINAAERLVYLVDGASKN